MAGAVGGIRCIPPARPGHNATSCERFSQNPQDIVNNCVPSRAALAVQFTLEGWI